MSSFFSFLIVYLLGGISFLPLVLGLAFLHAYLTFPVVDPEQDGHDDAVSKTEDEKLVRRPTNSADVAAGYFAVTREFVPGGVNGKPPERTSPAGSAQPANDSPSVYQTMYRSLFDRRSSTASTDSRAKKTSRRAQNEFFVVLRHGHLMLYDDAEQSEVRHVVSLGLYSVSIYGGGEEIPEGELYIRRNAICLTRKSAAVDRTLDVGQNAMPFFLFSENCSLKEDFYFALLRYQEKSDDSPVPPTPLRYDQKNIISLVQRLHSSEEHLQTNWLNGLLGRIFLAIYKTSDVEQFIRTRITKKIARVNKPNFLSDIVLQKVHVGEGVPSITNPRLKEMTVDGDFCAEADLTYDGNFRLEVAAKATLQLASRFKPREVNLVLSVTLKRLEGHVLIKIKPPPSNRLWVAFETMPKMELDIQPIVGSRQVIWGPVLRTIEGRIREVIAETLVLPHYDDTPFTDTIDQEFRGGIWEELASSQPSTGDSMAEKGSVDGVEKEDSLDESQPHIGTPPMEPLEKSMSMPVLAQVAPGADNKRAASVIGLSETVEGSPSRPKSPSLKSLNGERKKSNRAQYLAPIPPSPPVVATNAVNVPAVWGKDNAFEKGAASSAVMAMSRSRSSSTPNTPSASSHQAGEFPAAEKTADSTPEIANDQRSEKSSHSSLDSQPETNEPPPPQGEKGVPRPSTPSGSHSSSPAPSVSRTSTNASNSSSGLSSRLNKTTPEKLSVAAVGTLTTAVRNWYKSRNVPGEPSTDSHPTPPPLPSRKLPPVEIPLPPQKKTEPINVPKRKALPPPLLPTRNNTKRQASAPPAPPRNHDELFVVPAPDSEPTTPSSATGVGYEGSYMERGGNESLSSTLMFPGTDSSSPSASVSPGTSRRSTSSRTEDGSSGERIRKRLPRRTGEEETEQWHAAEEAELRTKVPWEPDEALT